VSESAEATLAESIEEKVRVSKVSGDWKEESGRTPLVRGGGGSGGGGGDDERIVGELGR
jgi:hypothetical protein